MHIVCPHCTTSYAIQPSSLGPNGRTLRCSRCKETWVAYPESPIKEAPTPAMDKTEVPARPGEAGSPSNVVKDFRARNRLGSSPPIADSPPIGNDWHEPAENASEIKVHSAQAQTLDDQASDSQALDSQALDDQALDDQAWEDKAWDDTALDDLMTDDDDSARPQPQPWFRRPLRHKGHARRSARRGVAHFGLPAACAAMGALMAALIVWRADTVRLLPQTAPFYRMVGLDVNLRGLAFKDIKFTTETVDGKQVWVIEGVIVDNVRKPVDIPRLHFSVRDAQGAEIYAWNTVPEQSVLKPGERAFFKSRLASPPVEGRNIDIGFVGPRDAAGRSA